MEPGTHATLRPSQDGSVQVRLSVVLFSNASTRLNRELDTLGLSEEVDAAINSSELGLAKPEPAAFLQAARSWSVPPSRCLFVDDNAANVAGARSAGMHAHRFTSPSALRGLLAAADLFDRRMC